MPILATEMRFASSDEWYSVSSSTIRAKGGGALLNCYDNSLYKALKTIYPEKVWLPFKFLNCPNGYWESTENRKASNFLNRFYFKTDKRLEFSWMGRSTNRRYRLRRMVSRDSERSYGIPHSRDVTISQEFFGNRDNNTFPGTSMGPHQILEISEISLEFNRQPKVSFISWMVMFCHSSFFPPHVINFLRRKYLEALAEKRGIHGPEGWYNIRASDLKNEIGLRSLLAHYSGSLFLALRVRRPIFLLGLTNQAIFSDHEWEFHKFKVVPKNFWDDVSNHRILFDDLGTRNFSAISNLG